MRASASGADRLSKPLIADAISGRPRSPLTNHVASAASAAATNLSSSGSADHRRRSRLTGSRASQWATALNSGSSDLRVSMLSSRSDFDRHRHVSSFRKLSSEHNELATRRSMATRSAPIGQQTGECCFRQSQRIRPVCRSVGRVLPAIRAKHAQRCVIVLRDHYPDHRGSLEPAHIEQGR